MSETNKIFRDIQKCLAGHSEREVVSALISSLIVAIGVSSRDIAHAESVISALPNEMIPLLRQEWSGFRQHRTKAALRETVLTEAMLSIPH